MTKETARQILLKAGCTEDEIQDYLDEYDSFDDHTETMTEDEVLNDFFTYEDCRG